MMMFTIDRRTKVANHCAENWPQRARKEDTKKPLDGSRGRLGIVITLWPFVSGHCHAKKGYVEVFVRNKGGSCMKKLSRRQIRPTVAHLIQN